MKMEMSYRDKMIALGLLIVIILAVGFFALIKPKYEKWQSHKATYQTTKETWDGIDMKIQAIDPLKTSITNDYNEAQKEAAIFINTAFASANETFTNEKTSYEMDQYLQAAIDECKLEVTAMDIPAVSAETMEYYYYTPDVLTYSLLEAADVNGEYAKMVALKMAESIILPERETVQLMTETITLTVDGTKENLMLFLDKIKEDNNAVLVNSVSISDYQFLGGLEIGPDGEPIITPGAEGTSSMTLAISFYNAKEIDEPILGD